MELQWPCSLLQMAFELASKQSMASKLASEFVSSCRALRFCLQVASNTGYRETCGQFERSSRKAQFFPAQPIEAGAKQLAKWP